MKSSFVLLLTACCAAWLTGCATGQKYSEAKATIPPLAQDSGRIFFYRTAVMGAGVQPGVKLNGQLVGKAKPKGFFYVDRPPAQYRVETSTEVTRRLSLTLEQGQTRYVRFGMAMGFFVGHVYPELVDNEVGEKEIAACKLAPGD